MIKINKIKSWKEYIKECNNCKLILVKPGGHGIVQQADEADN